MFKIEYILELISGKLTDKGYKSFISGIAKLVRKYHWSKNIIISQNSNSKNWDIEDVQELIQQFFEYAISKNKFSYLEKIPRNYLSYYFTQIFISFIANRISEEQQKQGLSYEKCKELVLSIAKEKYIFKQIGSVDYVFTRPFSDSDIKSNLDLDNELKYLSPIIIKESVRQFKPLVVLALEDVFSLIDNPVQFSKLIEVVYRLLDQSAYINTNTHEEYDEIPDCGIDESKYRSIINEILNGISKNDAKLILEYLFQTQDKVSLTILAEKYSLAKSTAYYKIERFKKKLIQNYMPINEEDGILFIQKVKHGLDELSE
ncbi:MAG TPA: hypothetical protein PLW77_09390 [Bacteroidales bacterium]|nr:hypothetical protein [Bacteroidales bacterium]